jgi:hypothetical protein
VVVNVALWASKVNESFTKARATYVPAAGAVNVAVPLTCPFVYPQATKLVFADPEAAMATQSFAFPGSPR